MAGARAREPRDRPEPSAGMEKMTCEAVTSGECGTAADEIHLVSFGGTLDPQDPKNWPCWRKWAVTAVLSVTGFNRIAVSTIMAPALPAIGNELHMSAEAAVMAMSVYLLATAFSPLAIGPLSEVNGRKPVLHATNIWFMIWNVICGFAHSKGMLIAARLLAGFGASAIYALAGGVLGDVWRPEQRGRSLGLYLLVPSLGAAVGPLIGGFIVAATTWRWIFWSTSIVQAIGTIVSLLVFHETHGPTILKERAEDLRRSTQDDRYRTVVERLTDDHSVFWILQRNLSRPIRLLMFHPSPGLSVRLQLWRDITRLVKLCGAVD